VQATVFTDATKYTLSNNMSSMIRLPVCNWQVFLLVHISSFIPLSYPSVSLSRCSSSKFFRGISCRMIEKCSARSITVVSSAGLSALMRNWGKFSIFWQIRQERWRAIRWSLGTSLWEVNSTVKICNCHLFNKTSIIKDFHHGIHRARNLVSTLIQELWTTISVKINQTQNNQKDN